MQDMHPRLTRPWQAIAAIANSRRLESGSSVVAALVVLLAIVAHDFPGRLFPFLFLPAVIAVMTVMATLGWSRLTNWLPLVVLVIEPVCGLAHGAAMALDTDASSLLPANLQAALLLVPSCMGVISAIITFRCSRVTLLISIALGVVFVACGWGIRLGRPADARPVIGPSMVVMTVHFGVMFTTRMLLQDSYHKVFAFLVLQICAFGALMLQELPPEQTSHQHVPRVLAEAACKTLIGVLSLFAFATLWPNLDLDRLSRSEGVHLAFFFGAQVLLRAAYEVYREK